THQVFEPEELPWPELGPVDLARMRAFPFWSYARSIEQRAGRMVSAFAQTLEDPVIREAVALQGVEETRHGRLMSHVLERYRIDVPELAIGDPPARKDDFCIFGFGECSDSFVGFGAFAIAREKNFLPESLTRIFENVLWEEARHIVFFINWWRYEEARLGHGLLQRTAEAVRYHVRAITGTAQGAADIPQVPAKLDDPELDAIVKSVTPAHFLAAALKENRRMMSRIDPRLVTPELVPTAALVLLTGLRLLPPRRAPVTALGGPQPVVAERSAA
ncbi:MAG: hypothetical protein JOZ24_07690, partial [Candidatus Eremiobacteraeota bacterium]|nr:hypothetical protein [Candidatus Eremiobacteraeota bacterium]